MSGFSTVLLLALVVGGAAYLLRKGKAANQEDGSFLDADDHALMRLGEALARYRAARLRIYVFVWDGPLKASSLS